MDRYTTYYMDKDDCGFRLVDGTLRTLYAVKRLIEAVNKDRQTDYPANYFTVGCFAWKSHNLLNL